MNLFKLCFTYVAHLSNVFFCCSCFGVLVNILENCVVVLFKWCAPDFYHFFVKKIHILNFSCFVKHVIPHELLVCLNLFLVEIIVHWFTFWNVPLFLIMLNFSQVTTILLWIFSWTNLIRSLWEWGQGMVVPAVDLVVPLILGISMVNSLTLN